MASNNEEKLGVIGIIGITIGVIVGVYLIIIGHSFLGGIAGFGIAFISGIVDLSMQETLKKSNKAKILGIGSLIIIGIILFCVLLGKGCESCSERESEYSDVFQKDPNTWTEDEEEYVNNFFEWQSEQD